MKKRSIIGMPPNRFKKGGPVVPSSIKKRDGEGYVDDFVGCDLRPNPNQARAVNLPGGPALRVRVQKSKQ